MKFPKDGLMYQTKLEMVGEIPLYMNFKHFAFVCYREHCTCILHGSNPLSVCQCNFTLTESSLGYKSSVFNKYVACYIRYSSIYTTNPGQVLCREHDRGETTLFVRCILRRSSHTGGYLYPGRREGGALNPGRYLLIQGDIKTVFVFD